MKVGVPSDGLPLVAISGPEGGRWCDRRQHQIQNLFSLQGKEIIAIKDMKSLRRAMWISAYLRCLILCLMKVQLQTKAIIRCVGQHCI